MHKSFTAALFLLPLVLPSVNIFAQKPADSNDGPPKSKRLLTAGDFLRMQMLKPKSLRRSSTFLGVKKSKSHLQVAFVLDGTESMDRELGALKSNLEVFAKGLRVHKRGDKFKIELTVVIYRDEDAESGAVTVTSPTFTADTGQLLAALSKVKTETGAPYFNELADQGIYSALTELNWAGTDQQVTRWIIVCGDAPPYPEGTDYRKHSTDQLIKIAKDKDIAIYSLLTNSGFLNDKRDNDELRKVATQLRPQSKAFMAKLSSETGGRFIDMWDRERVDNWLGESLAVVQKVPAITQREIDQFARTKQSRPAQSESIKIAILPHLPFESMTFDSKKPAVQVATAIRHKFRRLPGLSINQPHEVRQAFEDAKLSAGSDAELLKAIAGRLDANYIVWGEFKTDYDRVRLASRIYPPMDIKPLAQAEGTSDEDDNDGVRDMALFVARKLRERTVSALRRSGDDSQALAVFSAPDRDKSLARQLMLPVSQDARAQRSVLAGLDLLERSLQFVKSSGGPSGDEEAQAAVLLKEAVVELRTAALHEPDNPFTHLLLANCYFNLAQYDSGGDELTRHYDHLRLAYQYRNHDAFKDDPMRTEIEAIYALLVTKDLETAVKKYDALIQSAQLSKGRFALRAHWMLAGIHLGDWGSQDHAPQLVDANQARSHILNILALWPRSSEAAFYQRCIRDSRGESEMKISVGEGRLAASF